MRKQQIQCFAGLSKRELHKIKASSNFNENPNEKLICATLSEYKPYEIWIVFWNTWRGKCIHRNGIRLGHFRWSPYYVRKRNLHKFLTVVANCERILIWMATDDRQILGCCCCDVLLCAYRICPVWVFRCKWPMRIRDWITPHFYFLYVAASQKNNPGNLNVQSNSFLIIFMRNKYENRKNKLKQYHFRIIKALAKM